jgi:hypothetical protein
MVRRCKKNTQALITSRNIIMYNSTTHTVYIMNITLLRLRSTSWQLCSLLVFFYLQQLVTLWLQLSLLMSIVNVNLCWWSAVNKVVNCVLLVRAHHFDKATLRTTYLYYYTITYIINIQAVYTILTPHI